MEVNVDEIEYRVVLVDPGSRRIVVHKEVRAFRPLRPSIPAGIRVLRKDQGLKQVVVSNTTRRLNPFHAPKIRHRTRPLP
jgi:hypothetical protein